MTLSYDTMHALACVVADAFLRCSSCLPKRIGSLHPALMSFKPRLVASMLIVVFSPDETNRST